MIGGNQIGSKSYEAIPKPRFAQILHSTVDSTADTAEDV